MHDLFLVLSSLTLITITIILASSHLSTICSLTSSYNLLIEVTVSIMEPIIVWNTKNMLHMPKIQMAFKTVT
jgi:hypothetical protein